MQPSRIGRRVEISSTVFQDDIAKYSDTISNARTAADKLDKALKNKLLSVNYSKSKNLIIGSKKFRQKTLKELQSKPIMMGGQVLEQWSMHLRRNIWAMLLMKKDARRASLQQSRGELTNSTASVRI